MFRVPLTAKLDHGLIKSMACCSCCPELSECVSYALHKLQRTDIPLKTEQHSAMEAIYNHQDVFVWLSTGYGKSLVSEPDPWKNQKAGLGDRLGRKCTVRPEYRCTSDWFMIACLGVFIGNTNRNPPVQFKETKNKQDLLAREVFGAQICSYLGPRTARSSRKKVGTN